MTGLTNDTTCQHARLRRDLWRLLAGGLLFKVLLLLLERNSILNDNAFFFTDSGAYLFQSISLKATEGFRPKGYPMLLRLIWLFTGEIDFRSVVLVQSFLGMALPLVTYWSCRRVFKAPGWMCWMLALLSLVSPLSLMLERYILAEALAAFLLCLALWLFFRLLDDRPRWPDAVGLGLALLALQLTRLAWLFLPVLMIALLIFHYWRDKRLLRSAFVILVLVAAYYLPYRAYVHWYSLRIDGNLDYVDSGASRASGWALWCQVAPLAEPVDLADLDYGPLLTSDLASLQKGPNYQGFCTSSTAHMMRRTYCKGKYSQANALLATAAKRVVRRHPFKYGRLVAGVMSAYFSRRVDENLALRLDRNATWIKDLYRMHTGKNLFSPTVRDDQPHCLLPWLLRWAGTRKFFLLAIAVGTLVGLVRWRKNGPLLYLGLIASAYFGLICAGGFFVDRYFHPLEIMGLMMLGGLGGVVTEKLRELWSRRQPGEAAGPSVPAPAAETGPELVQTR